MSTLSLQSIGSNLPPRLRRIGVAGIALFTLKGLVWLAVPVMVRWWMS